MPSGLYIYECLSNIQNILYKIIHYKHFSSMHSNSHWINGGKISKHMYLHQNRRALMINGVNEILGKNSGIV